MKKTLYKTNQNDPSIRAYKEAVEKGKRNQHILPYGKKWAVTNLAPNRVNPVVFDDPQVAMQYAETNATAGTAIFIHSSDGRIRERKDY